MTLILASTSPYRSRLLDRLQVPFQCADPHTDETPLPDESPDDLALRLSLAKAHDVAGRNPGAWVIGSDQVAALGDRIMGKPGSHEIATQQLRASSGKEVRFYTGVALVGGPKMQERFHVEHFSVYFQSLSDSAIERYLLREQPYDCAGSFKCEGLGVVLFAKLQGDDPTSLEGLPLITVTKFLREVGIDPLLY